jgi:hypothetical protein
MEEKKTRRPRMKGKNTKMRDYAIDTCGIRSNNLREDKVWHCPHVGSMKTCRQCLKM